MDNEEFELLQRVEHHLEAISIALMMLVLEKGGGQETDWFKGLRNKLAENSEVYFKKRTTEEEEKK